MLWKKRMKMALLPQDLSDDEIRLLAEQYGQKIKGKR
jgi:hypothetical protein